MANVSLIYQTKTYLSVYGCQDVAICLDSTWAAKTVSGAPIIKATVQNHGRPLGSAGGTIIPPWENPRGEQHYQYEFTYDDTQITDPVTDVIGCADVKSIVDACAADAMIDVYANLTPWVEGTGVVYLENLTDLVGIATDTPTAALDVDSDIIRLRQSKTPATAADTGNAGDIAWDADYIYVCVAANTWKRVAIATW